MYIASPCSLNPITGREVWLCREIPGGDYSDDWVLSFVVARRFWFSRNTKLQLSENVGTVRRYMAAISKRLANDLESLFAVGTGTTGDTATMEVEGRIGYREILNVMGW